MIPRGVVRFDFAKGTVTLPENQSVNVAGYSASMLAPVFKQQPREAKGPELWAELHSKQDPKPEWFEDWLSRVPNFGCSCQKSFREYVKENPPRFDDFYNWSVEAHNWVNAKLSKPIWSAFR